MFFCETGVSHSSVAEGSHFLGCDNVAFVSGSWCFKGSSALPSSSGSSNQVSLSFWTALPWGWRHYEPLSHQELLTQQHSVTSKKTFVFKNFPASAGWCSGAWIATSAFREDMTFSEYLSSMLSTSTHLVTSFKFDIWNSIVTDQLFTNWTTRVHTQPTKPWQDFCYWMIDLTLQVTFYMVFVYFSCLHTFLRQIRLSCYFFVGLYWDL